jgi:hypothetical protein
VVRCLEKAICIAIPTTRSVAMAAVPAKKSSLR